MFFLLELWEIILREREREREKDGVLYTCSQRKKSINIRLFFFFANLQSIQLCEVIRHQQRWKVQKHVKTLHGGFFLLFFSISWSLKVNQRKKLERGEKKSILSWKSHMHKPFHFFFFANKATGVSNKQASTVGRIGQVVLGGVRYLGKENVKKKEYTYPHQERKYLYQIAVKMQNRATSWQKMLKQKEKKKNLT